MFNQTNRRRDAFTHSLGGMTAFFGGFTGIPAIADDRFNKKCDEQQSAGNRQEPANLSQRSGRKAA